MSLLLGNTTNAHAQQTVRADHFFDFEYAKGLWHELKTAEERERAFTEACKGQIEPMYDSWYELFQTNSGKAIDELERHPQADGIKRCYDLLLTGQVWREAYRNWRDDLSVYGSNGWNKDDTKKGLRCTVVSMTNIFTHKCTDLPDWRQLDDIKKDEARIQQGNARWIKKKRPEGAE